MLFFLDLKSHCSSLNVTDIVDSLKLEIAISRIWEQITSVSSSVPFRILVSFSIGRVITQTEPNPFAVPLPNPSMPRADPRRPRSSNEISITWSEEKTAQALKDDDFEQAVRAVEVR